MTTLDTRPRAPGLRPLSLGCTTGRTPDLKMATAPTPTSCDSAWSCPGHASAGRPRYLGTLQDRRQTGHYGQDRPGRVRASAVVSGRRATRCAGLLITVRDVRWRVVLRVQAGQWRDEHPFHQKPAIPA